MTDESNRYAPPLAHVEDVATSGRQLAGRAVRLGAVLIDVAIAVAAIFIVRMLTPFDPLDAAGGMLTGLFHMVLGFVIFIAVHGYLLVTRGQTVGKMLLGLRIVRPDGSLPSPGRVIGLRYGVGWLVASVPFIGALYGLVDALLIFRESRQCLHDQIADTIVVKA